MAQLRIGLAQVDSTVGDLPGNADIVSEWTAKAIEHGCHLVAFPEMMLTGYPPEDLVLRSSFVAASLTALDALAVRLATEGAGELQHRYDMAVAGRRGEQNPHGSQSHVGADRVRRLPADDVEPLGGLADTSSFCSRACALRRLA